MVHKNAELTARHYPGVQAVYHFYEGDVVLNPPFPKVNHSHHS